MNVRRRKGSDGGGAFVIAGGKHSCNWTMAALSAVSIVLYGWVVFLYEYLMCDCPLPSQMTTAAN